MAKFPSPEQLSRKRKQELGSCSKEARRMAKEMLDGADRTRIAGYLGVLEDTLADKVNQGRFSISEFLLMAHLCGYTLEAVPRHKDLIDGEA